MKTKATLALAVFCVLVTACADKKDASKSNFKTSIQAYLDTRSGLCFTPPAPRVPFTLSAGPELNFGGGASATARADALVEAGLLKKQETTIKGGPFAMPAAGFEYTATELGSKLLVKGAGKNIGAGEAFCAGKYKVVEVTSFTEPSDALGVKISQVTYRLSVDDVPGWAKSEALLKANPAEQKDLAPDATARAVVVLTSEGWIHETLYRKR